MFKTLPYRRDTLASKVDLYGREMSSKTAPTWPHRHRYPKWYPLPGATNTSFNVNCHVSNFFVLLNTNVSSLQKEYGTKIEMNDKTLFFSFCYKERPYKDAL